MGTKTLKQVRLGSRQAGLALLLFHLLYACGTPADPVVEQPDAGQQDTDAGPDEQPDAGPKEEEIDAGPLPEGACRTSVPASDEAAQTVTLCELEEGDIQHVRVDGVQLGAGHQAFQLIVGAATAPADPRAPLGDDQLRVQLYAGTPKTVYLDFGAASFAFDGTRDFSAAPSTVCFDLVGGSVTAGPSVTLWVTGEHDADCHDLATLSVANAYVSHHAWVDDEDAAVVGVVAREEGAFVYQGKGAPTKPVVTLLPEPAVEPVEEIDAGPLPEGACRTSVPASDEAAQTVTLCELEEGDIQHVRVDGVQLGAGHQAFQLIVGAATAPADPRAPLGDDQLRVQLYAGTPKTVYLDFGAASFAFDGTRDFSAAPSSVCFDLVGGSDTHAPAVTFWVTGEHEADCHDVATLSRASAYFEHDAWTFDEALVVGPVGRASGAYVYQGKGAPSAPVVTVAPSGVASCETLWTENAEWQPLCTPAGGATHVRIEGVSATQNSRYFYLVAGETDAPEGSPATTAGDGKFILTGGRSHAGESWTYARFNGVTQGDPSSYVYATDDDQALYVDQASTLCVDLGDDPSGNGAFTVWATGARGADCSVRATLTAESALITQVGDAPRAVGKNFVKTSNSGVGLQRVVVSND